MTSMWGLLEGWYATMTERRILRLTDTNEFGVSFTKASPISMDMSADMMKIYLWDMHQKLDKKMIVWEQETIVKLRLEIEKVDEK